MHHLPVIGDFWASVRLKFVFLKFDRVNQFRKSIDLLTGLGQEEQCSPAGAYRAEPTRPKPSARRASAATAPCPPTALAVPAGPSMRRYSPTGRQPPTCTHFIRARDRASEDIAPPPLLLHFAPLLRHRGASPQAAPCQGEHPKNRSVEPPRAPSRRPGVSGRVWRRPVLHEFHTGAVVRASAAESPPPCRRERLRVVRPSPTTSRPDFNSPSTALPPVPLRPLRRHPRPPAGARAVVPLWNTAVRLDTRAPPRGPHASGHLRPRQRRQDLRPSGVHLPDRRDDLGDPLFAPLSPYPSSSRREEHPAVDNLAPFGSARDSTSPSSPPVRRRSSTPPATSATSCPTSRRRLSSAVRHHRGEQIPVSFVRRRPPKPTHHTAVEPESPPRSPSPPAWPEQPGHRRRRHGAHVGALACFSDRGPLRRAQVVVGSLEARP
jgi:hypothetical protein